MATKKGKSKEERIEEAGAEVVPQIPETAFEAPDVNDLDDKIQEQVKDFTALLDSLSSLEDKKKSLWKQIYENAVTDRRNAYILFGDLYKDVHDKQEQHALHGVTLTKYLERMEKANAQLIKLAEMIDEVAEMDEDELTNEDDMYERIKKTTGNT